MSLRGNRRIDVGWRRGDIVALLMLCVLWTISLTLAAGGRRWFIEQAPVIRQRFRAAAETIDPNIAGPASLRRLSGIGPVLAEAIVEYRRQHGPGVFVSADDMLQVPGIGRATVRRMAPHLSLEPAGE